MMDGVFVARDLRPEAVLGRLVKRELEGVTVERESPPLLDGPSTLPPKKYELALVVREAALRSEREP